MGEKFKERVKSNLGLEFEVPGIQLLATVMIGKGGKRNVQDMDFSGRTCVFLRWAGLRRQHGGEATGQARTVEPGGMRGRKGRYERMLTGPGD